MHVKRAPSNPAFHFLIVLTSAAPLFGQATAVPIPVLTVCEALHDLKIPTESASPCLEAPNDFINRLAGSVIAPRLPTLQSAGVTLRFVGVKNGGGTSCQSRRLAFT